MKMIVVAFIIMTTSSFASAPELKTQTKLEKIEATVRLVIRDPGETKIYMAILWNESRYNHAAFNLNTDGSHDFGIAQLNSRYWNPDKKYYGVDIRTMRGNVYAGAKFFVSLTGMFSGNIRAAVTAYNCGAGAVMRGMIPDSSKKYADRVLQMAAKSGIYSKAFSEFGARCGSTLHGSRVEMRAKTGGADKMMTPDKDRKALAEREACDEG